MPTLLAPADLEVLQRRTLGAEPVRMLREMAEAIEALTAERGLVLVLQDLQWSDVSTVDLIAFLARRQQPTHLLLVGTYRPSDVSVHAHPLRAMMQELYGHGQCTELPLPLLLEEDVCQYIRRRFPHHHFKQQRQR